MAIIQGLTEFLPVSSSGHLVIAQYLMDITEHILFVDIVLHAGTLLAVIVYFRGYLIDVGTDFQRLQKKEIVFSKSSVKVAYYAIVACLPSFIVAFFFKPFFKEVFSSIKAVSLLLLINALVLFLTIFIKRQHKDYHTFNIYNALLIGCAQCFAILPGISRSGMTISCGLLCGLQPSLAFLFSFLMSIPTIGGALLFKFNEVATLSMEHFLIYSIGICVAAVIGYAALALLRRFVNKYCLFYFSFYCFILGITVYYLSN